MRRVAAPMSALTRLGASRSRVVDKAEGFHSHQSLSQLHASTLRVYERCDSPVPRRPRMVQGHPREIATSEHKSKSHRGPADPIDAISTREIARKLRGALHDCASARELAACEAIIRSGQPFTVAARDKKHRVVLCATQHPSPHTATCSDTAEPVLRLESLAAPSGEAHGVHQVATSNEFLVRESKVLNWLLEEYWRRRAFNRVEVLYTEMQSKLTSLQSGDYGAGLNDLRGESLCLPDRMTRRFLTSLYRQEKFSDMVRFYRQNQNRGELSPALVGIECQLLVQACDRSSNADAAFELIQNHSTKGGSDLSVAPFDIYRNALELNLFRHPDQLRGLANAIEISGWMTHQAGYFLPSNLWGSILWRMIQWGYEADDIIQWIDRHNHHVYGYNAMRRVLKEALGAKSQERTQVCLEVLSHFLKDANSEGVLRWLPSLLNPLIQSNPSRDQLERFVDLMVHRGVHLSRQQFQMIVTWFLDPSHDTDDSCISRNVDDLVAFYHKSAPLCDAALAVACVPISKWLASLRSEGVGQMRRLVDALGFNWNNRESNSNSDRDSNDDSDSNRDEDLLPTRTKFVDEVLAQLLQQQQVDRSTLVAFIEEANALHTPLPNKRWREISGVFLDRNTVPEDQFPEDSALQLVRVANENCVACPWPWALLNFALLSSVQNNWLVASHQLVQFAAQHGQTLDMRTVQQVGRFFVDMESPQWVLESLAQHVEVSNASCVQVDEEVTLALLNALLQNDQVDQVLVWDQALNLTQRLAANQSIQQVIVEATKRRRFGRVKEPSANPRELQQGERVLEWLHRVFGG